MWRYQSAKWRLHQGLPCQPRWAEIGMKTGGCTAWYGRPPGPRVRYGRCLPGSRIRSDANGTTVASAGTRGSATPRSGSYQSTGFRVRVSGGPPYRLLLDTGKLLHTIYTS